MARSAKTNPKPRSAGRRPAQVVKDRSGNARLANDLAAIVLAAGKGTRMRSARAKVLHELLGRPLGLYPIELARGLGADPVVAVLGHQREAVEA
ncbi:MAG TPA: NTP transferase domain-containing protein, partial [Polyangia bacterium]|nr:NTP transferase domain-containing protein [Polyangia bacterium]